MDWSKANLPESAKTGADMNLIDGGQGNADGSEIGSKGTGTAADLGASPNGNMFGSSAGGSVPGVIASTEADQMAAVDTRDTFNRIDRVEGREPEEWEKELVVDNLINL